MLLASTFPVPDPHWPTNPSINAAFTIGAALPVLAGLILAVRIRRTEGSPVGLVCILGGGVASLVEPLVTYVGFVHYPRQQQWTVFTGFGEAIPLFLVLAYTAEIGLGSFAVWRLLRAGGGPAAIIKVWIVVLLADVVLETPTLWLHVFYYYGPRPLNLFGFPLYWAPLDATLALLPGTLMFLLLEGRRWRASQYLLALALFPTNVLAVYVGAGWPVFSLQHAQVSAVWLQLAGLLTVTLSYLMARSVAALSAVPRNALTAAGLSIGGPQSTNQKDTHSG